MTAPTIIRKPQARKLAEIARETGVVVEVEIDGRKVRFVPATPPEPLARDEEIVL